MTDSPHWSPGPSADGAPALVRDVPLVDPSLDAWKIRHRIIMASLLFIAAQLVYAQVFQKSEAIAQTVLTNGYWAGSAIIGAYVFGRAYENVRLNR